MVQMKKILIFGLVILFTLPMCQVFALEGDKLWTKHYGGSGSDYFIASDQTIDGGFVASGSTTSNNGDFTNNKGLSDMVIAKFDSNGNKLWMKNYGGTADENLASIQQTSDGGFIGVGTSTSNNGDLLTNQGSSDFVIAKFDSNGNKVWMKTYGGSNSETLTDVKQTSDGGYVAVGNSYSLNGDVPGNKGSQDFIIAKFDSNGNKIWIKNYGSTGLDTMLSVVIASDGGFVAVGEAGAGNGDIPVLKGGTDAIAAKFDSSGNKVWIKNYGGSSTDIFSKIVTTIDMGYAIVGRSQSSNGDLTGNKGLLDGILIKLDSNGNKVWMKNYGGTGDDYFRSLEQNKNGDYLVSGYSKSANGDIPTNKGGSDLIVGRFDRFGNKTWIKSYGGSLDDRLITAHLVNEGAVAFGYTNSTNLDVPGNYGEIDTFAAKFSFSSDTFVQAAVGIQSGNFTLAAPSMTSNFGNITLNGLTQTVYASTNMLSVSDYTGQASGYHVTVQASAFIGIMPGNNLANGSLKISPPSSISSSTTTAAPPNSQIAIDTVIDNGSPVNLLRASANEGMGSFNVNFNANNLTLIVMPSAKTDTYSSVITWTIVSGP